MNGRALGDRAIEVSPSSARVLERAAEILTPFPVCHLLPYTNNSRVRTDLVLATGLVRRAGLVISNVAQHVSDARIHHPLRKAVREIHRVSCTVSLPRCNPHPCPRTCQTPPANRLKHPVPRQCPGASPSVPATGNAALKVVDTTTLQRMCLVFVAAQVALKQL
jgi:hypothetical protein